MINSPLIVALDVESAAEARSLVAALADTASFYKVGPELYAAAGMDFARELKSQGHRVFLDLKLYDIPETVRRSVVQVSRAGVDFLTIHARCSLMRAAKEAATNGLKLLAVTVLTSLDDADLRQDGHTRGVADLVELRARNAVEMGMDGIVCSPLEVARVRAITGSPAILVTPGVRSAGAATGDQKRVMTPAEAIASGADYLVIGRQVTRAKDPRAEMLRILTELNDHHHSSGMQPLRETPRGGTASQSM